MNVNIKDDFFKKQRTWTQSELKNASEQRQKRVEQSKQAEEKWKEEAKKIQKSVDARL